MVFAFLIFIFLLAIPARAQKALLIDILREKGILSREEAQKLINGAAAKGGDDLQALVGLLRAKGVLEEKDLARLKAPAAMAAAPATQLPLSSAQEMNERLSRLEQEVSKKPPFLAGYDEGFFVRSADGNFSLRVGGRAATHALFQQQDTSQNDSLFMDRARFYTEGVAYKYFQYKVETDFTSSLGLRDAYLNVNYSPLANVQIGQYKVPFSYEALTSKRYIDFVERSAVTLSTVNPSRDIGLMLHGRLGDGLIGYQLAMLNGSGQNRSDTNSAKDLAARFVLAPFVTSIDSILSGLNFGGSVTYGHEPKGKSISGLTPTGFEFFRAVDVRGQRVRAGGHLAWFYGPYSITGEFIHTSEEREKLGPNGEDLSDFVTQGGYIGGTWLLTRERKIYNKPNRPSSVFLDPIGQREGWGSWELAARYEYFILDNESDGKPGAVKRNRFDGVSLGLNWYLNPWTRVSVEYLYSLFDDANRSPRLGHHSVSSILSRVQLEF